MDICHCTKCTHPCNVIDTYSAIYQTNRTEVEFNFYLLVLLESICPVNDD